MQAIQNFSKIFFSLTGIILLVVLIKNYAKIKTFIMEVKAELTKVSWSSRDELIGSTFVIIGITFIIALFVGMIDLILSKILSLLFR